MDKILGNKFLIANALTYEFSKNASQELDYDFFSVHDDIVRAVNADWRSKNLDRRSIAVGTDFYMHVWDLLSGKVAGWKEMVYISTGIYSQMVVDLIKPTSALVASPDRNFDFVSDLNRRGCALTFLNNDCLQAFEAHVLTHPEYKFTGDYTVIEYAELEAMTEPQFDFVHMHSPDLTLNPALIGKIVDITNSGGALYLSGVNEMMRLYSPDYYIEPLYDLYEALDERTDITSYHIPHAIGFQILVKK
jgi:hypothetical protein